MAKRIVYVWIGDDGDNKSVSIDRKVYVSGSEIPVDNVDADLLATWIKCGLVSEDGKRIVSVEATELEAENKALKSALEKAKSGKKADAVKAAEKRAEAAEADVKEKAALIEKHAARITELEAEVEELTKPEPDAGGDGGGADSAGPGGSSE